MPSELSLPASTQFISALVAKFCHDLINPLGSMQMVLDCKNPDIDLINKLVSDAIMKLNLFRSCFNNDQAPDNAIKHLKEFIELNSLNFIIESASRYQLPLIFFIAVKMLKSSTATLKNASIEVTDIFITQTELNALNLIIQAPSAENIIPYTAAIFAQTAGHKIEISQSGKSYTFRYIN